MLLILLIVTSISFVLALSSNRMDYSNPIAGVFFFLNISILFAVVGNTYWNNDVTFRFVLSVIICYLGIIVGGIIGRALVRKPKGVLKSYEVHRIDIKSYKLIVIIGSTLVLTVLYAQDVLRVGSKLGSYGLSAIAAVRRSKDSDTNFIIRQGIKLVMAAAYVNGFVFINNIISTGRKAYDFIYLIPVICGCVCSIFTGVRTEIFRLVIALYSYSIVLYNQQNNWLRKNKALRQTVKKFSIPIILAIILFFAARHIVKGVTALAENNYYDAFEYVCFYIGSPWLVLNNKISVGLAHYTSSFFGGNTFSMLLSDLIDAGVLKRRYSSAADPFIVVDPQTGANGNADTLFGSPLTDFDTFGTFVFLVLLFSLINMYYTKYIYKSNDSNKRNLMLVYYAFLYYLIGFAFYSNIFTYFLTVYYISTAILIGIIYWYYLQFKT